MRPRILIAEGNVRENRAHLARHGTDGGSESYADAIRLFAPEAQIDIVYPADAAPELPAGMSIGGYDGVVIGGSGLHAYDAAPEVTRQVEFARAAFAARVPFLGSCWGLQVAAVASGGAVAKSPRGREVGIARKLRPTPAGRGHPLYQGRPDTFDCCAIHFDEVTHLPPGGITLAANHHSAIQAAVIPHAGGEFWGVQYHPEFDLRHMARLMSAYAEAMIGQGFYADRAALEAHTADWEALDADPERKDIAWRLGIDGDVLDPYQRCREIGNWLDRAVRPRMAERGN